MSDSNHIAHALITLCTETIENQIQEYKCANFLHDNHH